MLVLLFQVRGVVGPSFQGWLSRILAKESDVQHLAVVGGPASEHIGLQRQSDSGRCSCSRVVNVGDIEKVRIFDHAVGDTMAEGL
jgi:hypothetical protein